MDAAKESGEAEKPPFLDRRRKIAASVAVVGASLMLFGWAGPKVIQMGKQTHKAPSATSKSALSNAISSNNTPHGLPKAPSLMQKPSFKSFKAASEPFLFEHNIFLYKKQLHHLQISTLDANASPEPVMTSITQQDFSNVLPPTFNIGVYAMKAFGIATAITLTSFSLFLAALAYRLNAKSPSELAAGIRREMEGILDKVGMKRKYEALTEEDKKIEEELENLI